MYAYASHAMLDCGAFTQTMYCCLLVKVRIFATVIALESGRRYVSSHGRFAMEAHLLPLILPCGEGLRTQN